MKNEIHRFKGILVGLILLNSIILNSQVYVELNVDNENPHGFCDIVTYEMFVRNFNTPASTLKGRIEYNQNDFLVIDDSNLPNATYEVVSPSKTYIHFDISSIGGGQSLTFYFQMIVTAYTNFNYSIEARATRDSDSVFDEDEKYFTGGAIDYIPIYGEAIASELIDAYVNNGNYNGLLKLLPVNPPPGSPNFYACNENLGQRIYIEDKLTFDIPEYCFYKGANHGALVMGEGSEIIIEDGAKLTLDEVTIASCQKMWKGIYVKKGATLVLNNCIIANAKYAIQAERGSTIISDGTIYSDNYIGIYIPGFGYTQVDDAYVNVSLYRNQFVGSGSMKPPFTGQNPPPDDKPVAGISVNSLSFFAVYGNAMNQSANSFENLQNGILAHNTNLYVGDAFFKDIERDLSINSLIQGYGIYITDGKYSLIKGDTEGDMPPSYSNHFDNCDIGIFNSTGAIDVQGMTMSGVKKGIVIQNVRNKEISIQDNTIFSVDKGILLNLCIPATTGQIKYNDIFVYGSQLTSSCIEMNDFPIPTYWEIAQNYVQIGDGSFAIGNKAGYATLIMNNSVIKVHDDHEDTQGIYLSGSKYSNVSCNILEGDISGANYHNSSGIYLTGANNFNVSCNNISNFRYGLFAAGDNSSAGVLRGNTFGYQWAGLWLNENGVIGKQDHQGNIWDDSYVNYAAKHLGNSDIVPRSLFYYNPINDFEPPSISSVVKWFYDEDKPTFSCDLETLCPDGIGYTGLSPIWTELDQALVAGNLGFDNYNYPLSWMGRFHVFHRLKDYAGTLPTDISNFISNQQTLNIGKFSNSLDSLYEAIKYMGPYEDALSEFPLYLSHQFDEINRLDSLLSLEGSNDSLSQLIIEHYDSIYFFELDYMYKDSIINAELALKAIDAVQYIEAISPDSIWQELFQFTLLEALHLAHNDTLLSSETLYEIALSCPDMNGDAVYHARSLISLDSTINSYNDYTLCDSLVERSIQELPKLSGTLYPNPAVDYIEIELQNPIKNFVLFNSTGNIIHLESESNLNFLRFDIRTLSSGMYFINVTDVNDEQEIFKFIVIQ